MGDDLTPSQQTAETESEEEQQNSNSPPPLTENEDVEKHEKRSRLRHTVASEILTSERSYIEGLSTLIRLYVDPLTPSSSLVAESPLPHSTSFTTSHSSTAGSTSASVPASSSWNSPVPPGTQTTPPNSHHHQRARSGSIILNEKDANVIFSNIRQIFSLNSKLLADLEFRIKDWKDDSVLGDLFLRYAPFFLMYTEYVKNYEMVPDLLTRLIEKNKSFKQFCRDAELRGKAAGALDLGSYLIMPIQRIPRYRLLLGELLRFTETTHPDHASILKALALLDRTASHINQAMHDKKDGETVMKLGERFRPHLSLWHPHRKFIREGPLQKINHSKDRSKSAYFFLLNDLLIQAHPNVFDSNTYTLKRMYPIDEKFDCVDLPDTEAEKRKYRMKITNPVKEILVVASDALTKQSWLVDLQNCIKAAKDRQITLGDRSHTQRELFKAEGVDPSLKKEDFLSVSSHGQENEPESTVETSEPNVEVPSEESEAREVTEATEAAENEPSTDAKLLEKDKLLSELEVTLQQEKKKVEELEGTVQQEKKKVEELDVILQQEKKKVEELEVAFRQEKKKVEELEVAFLQEKKKAEELSIAVESLRIAGQEKDDKITRFMDANKLLKEKQRQEEEKYKEQLISTQTRFETERSTELSKKDEKINELLLANESLRCALEQEQAKQANQSRAVLDEGKQDNVAPTSETVSEQPDPADEQEVASRVVEVVAPSEQVLDAGTLPAREENSLDISSSKQEIPIDTEPESARSPSKDNEEEIPLATDRISSSADQKVNKKRQSLPANRSVDGTFKQRKRLSDIVAMPLSLRKSAEKTSGSGGQSQSGLLASLRGPASKKSPGQSAKTLRTSSLNRKRTPSSQPTPKRTLRATPPGPAPVPLSFEVKRQPPQPSTSRPIDIGLKVGPSSSYGVLVVEVKANSPASQAGLLAGDIITCVNGGAVYQLSQYTLTASRFKRGDKPLFKVTRDNTLITALLKIPLPETKTKERLEKPATGIRKQVEEDKSNVKRTPRSRNSRDSKSKASSSSGSRRPASKNATKTTPGVGHY